LAEVPKNKIKRVKGLILKILSDSAIEILVLLVDES